MYQYGKPRNKATISPKDNYLFGPQFHLQASATAVSERPAKGSPVGSREGSAPLKGSDSVGHGSALSRKGAQSTDSQNTIPGDRVIFAESPSAPGVPIVYRTPEERAANPDRLNLDRRHLSVCPILEGEDQLRLLNYQHNLITRIQHLSGLRRLIFLDLYDNQIEEISGLSALRSLRVLMLGKNRLRKIENLESLVKLDVLDLHGNQISQITNLNHLLELRVLNLAGNLIEYVDNLAGMDALAELNLRRNRIRTVLDVDALPSLQRLFLSFNEIHSFDDIACLGESHSLSEVSLDGNPFGQDQTYKQTVLRHMHQLRQLDMKRVTEDERRIASVMARKEEEKKRENNKIAVMKERRRLAINNARRQWEVMQGSMMSRTNKLIRPLMPELYANHMGSYANSDLSTEPADEKQEREETESSRSSGKLSRPTSAKSNLSEKGDWPGGKNISRAPSRCSSVSQVATPEKDRDRNSLGGPIGSGSSLNIDHLAELEGDTMYIYGLGALDAFDKNWGIQAAGAVTTISFKFVDFDDCIKHLHKVRARFPSVHTLIFNSTNISSLQQLNALSAVRRLDHLIIEADGNPVTQLSLWRTYTLFRLAHFSLKKINYIDVSASDIVNAEKFFGSLAHMTTSQLPQSRLLSILGETRKKQPLMLSDDKSKAKTFDSKFSDRSTESVGRAGLVYSSPDTLSTKTQEMQPRREFVKKYLYDLTKDAILVDQKRLILQQIWPQLFRDMVHKSVVDMWDSKAYMKRCMEDFEKS